MKSPGDFYCNTVAGALPLWVWRARSGFGPALAALHDYKNPLIPLHPLHTVLFFASLSRRPHSAPRPPPSWLRLLVSR